MAVDMSKWLDECLSGDGIRFLPMYFYPALKAAGYTAEEVNRAGGAEKMAEVMAASVDRFPEIGIAMTALDVTIDPEVFGCEVMYDPEAAPHVTSVVLDRKGKGLDTFSAPDAHAGRQDLHYEAVRLFKEKRPDKPVFGNLLGPFTLASSIMALRDAMVCVMKKQELMHRVTEVCTEFLIARAKAYKEAGADGLLLDEACGGIIQPHLSAEFSASYIKKIVDEIQTPDFPIMYHNCGNIKDMKESIYGTGCRMYSFGNMVDLVPMLEAAPAGTIVTGNLDPMLLSKASPEAVSEESLKILERCAEYPAFAFAPGCDCPPQTTDDNMAAMIRTLKDFNGR